ncbi:protein YLS9-like [Gossypium australe]|uniref:Protein YLS9-like n=1 Tax=Gossypium australe TaxID=47621 RepID=A0A5B6UBN5_9ROSI|nr:protein YLS9-like [Gossypium australe]
MSRPHSCSTASITSFNITPSSSSSSSSPSPSKRSLFVRRLIRTLVLLSSPSLHGVSLTQPHLFLNSTPFNISDTNYTTAFTITNPNKKLTLLLDNFEVLIKNVASRDQWMPTDKSLCLNNNAMGRVFKNISFLGNTFNVEVSLRTKFLAWNWLSKREFMMVCCRDLSVRFLSEKRTGNYSGEKGKCSVQVV